MRNKLKVESLKLRMIITVFVFFTLYFSLSTPSLAKVYIDITSPTFRQLPVSMSSSGHELGKEIVSTVKNDLDFTGIFYFMAPEVPGAEIKGTIEVEVAEKVRADVVVRDLIENKNVLNKRYSSSGKIVRSLSHSISNDIFEAITGEKGVFRTKLSYIGSTGNRKHLYMNDWDGYNPVRVVAKGLSLSHSWTPDGYRVVYSSERKKEWGIYLLNLRDYSDRALFTSKGLNLVGGISPDSRVAFSSSKGGNPEIYTMNMSGTEVKRLTRSYGIDVSPVFSPDGGRIAFVSDRGGSPQIYTMESDGKGVKRLTFQGSYNTSPAWSPDGKWIAYVGRKNGKNQIFMIKSDIADMRQLTSEGNNEGPTFSPDGMFIAFDSDREGNKGVYIMSLRSERVKRITPRSMKAMNPRWSPYFQKK
jgi:TolB protein